MVEITDGSPQTDSDKTSRTVCEREREREREGRANVYEEAPGFRLAPVKWPASKRAGRGCVGSGGRGLSLEHCKEILSCERGGGREDAGAVTRPVGARAGHDAVRVDALINVEDSTSGEKRGRSREGEGGGKGDGGGEGEGR